MINECSVWLNNSKSKCMILDGKRMFIGDITKKQLKTIEEVLKDNIISCTAQDSLFKDYYPSLNSNKVDFETIIFH